MLTTRLEQSDESDAVTIDYGSEVYDMTRVRFHFFLYIVDL